MKPRILWQGYAVKDTDEQVRAAYLAKFGKLPERIQATGGSKLAGPIEEGNDATMDDGHTGRDTGL